jgi:FKBP-type peptidyl-prolyl cis-trans isomerase
LKRTRVLLGLARTAAVASLAIACGGPGFPATTQAADARTDDLWLEGDPCAPVGQTDGGLKVEELAPGIGREIERGDTVRVHYSAAVASGAILHDTRAGGPPVEIVLGSTRTICGFERALVGMRAGGKRRVLVPWHLAFGEAGRGKDVQPKTDLVMIIEPFWPAEVATGRGGTPANRAPPAGGRRR